MLSKKEEGVNQEYITVGAVLDPSTGLPVDGGTSNNNGNNGSNNNNTNNNHDRWRTLWTEATRIPGNEDLPHATVIAVQIDVDPEGPPPPVAPQSQHATTNTIPSSSAAANDIEAGIPLPQKQTETSTTTKPQSPFSKMQSASSKDLEARPQQQTTIQPLPLNQGGATTTTSTSITSVTAPPSRSGFDLVLGSIMAFVAVLTAYVIELAAVLVYMIAAGFYEVGEWCKAQQGCICLLLFVVFKPIIWTLQLTDSILLITSVFLSELLGWIAFFLLLLFTGCGLSRDWRLYIRRICHLTRWAFRGFHATWGLQRRTLCFAKPPPAAPDNNEQTNQVMVVTNGPQPRVVTIDAA